MLHNVGIEWKYDMLDAVAVSDRNANLEYDVAIAEWLYIYDPDMAANGMYYPDSGINFGRSNNKKAIELIAAGKNEFEFEKRKQIYQELETVLYNNYEDAWLWWRQKARAFHKDVRGYDAQNYEKYMEAWKRSHYLSSLWFEN